MNLQAVHKHERWTFGSIFICTLMMIKPTKVDSKNYSGWPSLERKSPAEKAAGSSMGEINKPSINSYTNKICINGTV